MPGTFGCLTVPYDAMAFEAAADPRTAPGAVPVSGPGFLWWLMCWYARSHRVYGGSARFVPVHSAFKGLALYKTRSLAAASYRNDGSAVCEHVVLHAALPNKYASRDWISYQPRQGDGRIFKQIRNALRGR